MRLEQKHQCPTTNNPSAVSQFTLYASTRAGRKPDFHAAMVRTTVEYRLALTQRYSQGTQPSRKFYETFLRRMGETYNPIKVKDGEFGAM